MREATLCYLVKEDHVLLGLKKRGFAEGILNGYGGKVHPGESIEDTAARELYEESSVKVDPKRLERVAVIDFHFAGSDEHKAWGQRVYVFLAKTWEGEPIETEEMSPAWYRFSDIPYDRMWVDDAEWLPMVLEGKKLTATYFFNEDGKTIDRRELKLCNKF